MNPETVLTEFGKTLNRLRLYSLNHPMAADSLQTSYKALQELIAREKELNINFSEEQFLLNGSPLTVIGSTHSMLSQIFQKYSLQSLTFKQGITQEELTCFFKFLAAKDSDSKNNLRDFLEKEKINTITVNSAFYVKAADGKTGQGSGTGSGAMGAATGQQSKWHEKLEEMPLESTLWEVTKRAVEDPKKQKQIFDIILNQMKLGIEDHVKNATKNLEQEKQTISYEQQRTKSVIDQTAEGSVVVNEKGEIVMMNPAAEKIFGASFSELKGKELTRASKEELMISLAKELTSSASKEPTAEVLIQGSDKIQNAIRQSTATIKNPEGKVVGIVSMLSDVAKVKELQRMQDDFMAHVTHELRSPLTSIKAAIGALDEELPKETGAQNKKILSIAAKNVDRLSNLINELLDTAKIGAGKMTVTPKPIEPYPLLKEAVSSLESWANSKQISLTLDAKENLPYVLADYDRITQVIINFISNAIKFTQQGGKIKVTAAPSGSVYLKVSVTDTGKGIPKAEQEKLFSKFYQLKQETKSDTPGTGLGLYITKTIVELHKGQIGLESAEGKGSTFYFTLPITEAPLVSGITETSGSDQKPKKKNWISRLFGK